VEPTDRRAESRRAFQFAAKEPVRGCNTLVLVRLPSPPGSSPNGDRHHHRRSGYGHRPPQEYSAEDGRTWLKIRNPLFRHHDRYACSDYLRSRAAVLPDGVTGVPRPGDVSRRVDAVTGFRIVLACGVVPGKEFFENLRGGRLTAVPVVRPGEEWRFCSARRPSMRLDRDPL
jgi:phenylalanine-4-hydroxylase